MGEDELVMVGTVEVEDPFGIPEKVFDPGFSACLLQDLPPQVGPGVLAQLDPSAGKDPVTILIYLRQEHVNVVNGEAGGELA